MTQHTHSTSRIADRAAAAGTLLSAAIFATVFSVDAASAASPGRLGFVIESWKTAIYETEYMEECPEGVAIGNDEIWFNGLSREQKELATKGGTLQVLDLPRRPQSYLRGPNGEDVCWSPTSVVDPPMRIVGGRYSYGLNLDGNTDGAATPKTCAHENFVGVDGTPGVDNQLYRLMGCVYGYRDKGYLEHHANRERQDESKGIILIDVSGVDDARNDDAVSVTFYLSATNLHFDTLGRIVPYASYEAVRGRYGQTVPGRIVDGVIETQTGDMTLPIYGNDAATDMVFKDFSIRIEPSEDGTRAAGMWAGYHPVDSFWDHIVKVQHNAPVGQYDCPAMFVAAHELADGYPDPVTGQCTALSSAFHFEAVAAFVISPPPGEEVPAERLAKGVVSVAKPATGQSGR
ncbi:MAG: hypothetical protein SFV21_16345 [Rhodospirillaceae bacterium]|nr:hypothetical protein [Rhodospirillaceae bacterium]